MTAGRRILRKNERHNHLSYTRFNVKCVVQSIKGQIFCFRAGINKLLIIIHQLFLYENSVPVRKFNAADIFLLYCNPIMHM